MSENDLIRRGDAMAAVRTSDFRWEAEAAIAALPAVTVGVPEAVIHRSVLDWIRDDTGAAIKMTITPDQANALTGRILAALEPVAAPRRYMGQIMAECDCSRQSECEAAQRCLAAPDPGHHVNEPPKSEHDAGNVLTPDPAAIREAALREAAEACIAVSVDPLTQVGREHAPWMKATAEDCARVILALIQKGPEK